MGLIVSRIMAMAPFHLAWLHAVSDAGSCARVHMFNSRSKQGWEAGYIFAAGATWDPRFRWQALTLKLYKTVSLKGFKKTASLVD